jgi:1,2-diacylglycerol 3-alpha-glucosyltransferase
MINTIAQAAAFVISELSTQSALRSSVRHQDVFSNPAGIDSHIHALLNQREACSDGRKAMQNHATTPNRKLHIGMVIDTYDAMNGAVLSTRRITEKLLERGHRVSVITTGEEGPGIVAMPAFYVPFAKRIMQKLKVPLARPDQTRLAYIIPQLDILHAQFPFWLSDKAISMALAAHKPVVATFHVQTEHLLHHIGIHSKVLTRLMYKWFIRHIYNKSDVVICPSEFARQELQSQGLLTNAIVISNGIPDSFRPDRSFVPAGNGFRVLTVGRLSPEKNQELLIDALRLLNDPSIELRIMGVGPLENHLRTHAARLPFKITIDATSSEGLIQYYNTADLYVHAAEVEVECMSAMEAMACACPLLISDAPKSATKQFALDERSLFRHGDAADLARKIRYWKDHAEERSQAALAYLALAQGYKLDATIDRIEGLYLDLASAA